MENYLPEIEEFLSAETLEEIDYGILDLSKVKDYELKEVYTYYGELLEMELRCNYLKNETGIFRVSAVHDRFYYCEADFVVEAESLHELKDLVLEENRIWYVFDEIALKRIDKEVIK